MPSGGCVFCFVRGLFNGFMVEYTSLTRCYLLSEKPLGEVRHPIRMSGNTQRMEDNSGEVLDLHILEGDVVDGLALDGNEDPLLLVCVGTVAAVVAAVVGGDDEEGILDDPGLLAGVVDTLGIAVTDVDLVEVILRAVAMGMARAVY